MRSFCKHLGGILRSVHAGNRSEHRSAPALRIHRKDLPDLNWKEGSAECWRWIPAMDATATISRLPSPLSAHSEYVYECDTAIIPTNRPITAPAKAKAELKVTKGCWGEGGGIHGGSSEVVIGEGRGVRERRRGQCTAQHETSCGQHLPTICPYAGRRRLVTHRTFTCRCSRRSLMLVPFKPPPHDLAQTPTTHPPLRN